MEKTHGHVNCGEKQLSSMPVVSKFSSTVPKMYVPNTYLSVAQLLSSKLFPFFEALSWHPTEIKCKLWDPFSWCWKKSTIFLFSHTQLPAPLHSRPGLHGSRAGAVWITPGQTSLFSPVLSKDSPLSLTMKSDSPPELIAENTWTISRVTLWNCIFYSLIYHSSSGWVTKLQISAGDSKRGFVLSCFNEVLCSAATAKLFELNDWDLLTLFLEVVPYSSLQATSLFHISLQTVIWSAISNGKLSPSICRECCVQTLALFFVLWTNNLHATSENTCLERNRWCVKYMMPNTQVILVALSSDQVPFSCRLCTAELGPWWSGFLLVWSLAAALEPKENASTCSWGRRTWPETVHCKKPQSTAGTKMMSLAYFKLATVANIFIFSYKSLHTPLNTRKWKFPYC